ncbi:Fur-regulated basic protein FbpA [Aquibacillus kalidii]|uniref:Fur-regulated basic protein FbpA n=1 Tax=Aquibacillus kalidii TaxID=2762597 RepID=UPI001645CBB0|nr:Fur-regulated basic protein FbpA [Aquibacillus kalidii]
MAYLRKALDKQKTFLINQLIEAGAVDHTDHNIYKKTITELEQEYKLIHKHKENSSV